MGGTCSLEFTWMPERTCTCMALHSTPPPKKLKKR